MKRILLTLATAVALLLSLGVVAASAQAADEVRITRVNYNAVGSDTLANRWQEGIYFRNNTTGELDISGWKVHDAYKNAEGKHTNSYTFPDETTLKPNGLVLVSPAAGVNKTDPNATQVFYMDFKKGYNGHFLNNGGDTVFVKKADNSLAAKFTYDFDNGYYVR